MQVLTLVTSRGGVAKNQFVLKNDNGDFTFQSYSTRIADYDCQNGILKLYKKYDCSNTTSKYLLAFIRQYLGCKIKSVRELDKDYLSNGTIIKKVVA